MQAKKAELVKSINNINSESVLIELSKAIERLTLPCQYTVEEVREGLYEAFNEYENGKLISHQEIKNRFKS